MKINFLKRFTEGARRAPAAFVVLAAGLLLTFLAWRGAARRVEADNRGYFEREIGKAKEEIQERVRSYVDVLYGVRGLFALHEAAPSSAEWKRYIDSLDLIRRYPGIHDIGFARYVREADRADFERKARRGAPSFSIHPPGERGAYYPIEYVEPFGSASHLLGFDIGGDPIRLAAIEQARDTGEAVSAGPILLVSPPNVGFAIRLPVYRRGASLESVEERRRALIGFVTSAYETDVMMREVFGEGPRDFDFEIYAGAFSPAPGAFSLGPASLLYDDDRIPHALDPGFRSRYSRWESLQIAGRTWSVYFTARPGFRAGLATLFPTLVLAAGVVISLSLFSGAWFLGVSRRRALDLALAMTADVRENEERFRAIFDQAAVGMAVTGLDGRWLRINQRLCDLVGYTMEELMERGFQGITHPEDLPADLASFHKVIAGETYVTEKRYLCKGGGEVWVSLKVFPVRTPSGRSKYIIAMMNDITERRRAEEALRESQRFLGTLIGALPGMVYRCQNDPAWTMLFVSKGCYDLTGYSPSDLEGSKAVSYAELVHPDDREWLWKKCRAALAAKEACNNEYRIINKAGEVKWVWERAEGIYSPDGVLLSIEGFITDVTERRKTEEALAEREFLFRQVVDSNMIGIIFGGRDGSVSEANEAFLKIVGYTREDLLSGKIRLDRMTPPEHHRLDEKAAREAMRLGVCAPYEKELIRKDGTRVPVLVGAATLPRCPGRGVGFILDISERRRTEEALAERENLLRMIFDAEPECVKLISVNGSLLNMNRAGLRMIEADRLTQVVGKSIYPLIDPRHRPAFKALTERVLRGEAGELEFRVIGLKGTRRWMETHAVPFRNRKGEIIALLAVTRDVTVRRRTEEELKSSREQLRSFSARLQWMLEEERTRIAREIHDELGQLLTALKMELSWVGNRLLDDPAPLGRKIQSMSELIDTTIQTVRRIATELRPGVLDDLGLTAAIEWQAREFQRRTGIRCDCDLPDNMSLDPARSTAIFRILQEALTNVARHAEASRIKIRLERQNGLVMMKIDDNGKGIEESRLAHPNSLGLLGMRERALLWGGKVEIRGTKGKGTAVTVKIPAHKREEKAP